MHYILLNRLAVHFHRPHCPIHARKTGSRTLARMDVGPKTYFRNSNPKAAFTFSCCVAEQRVWRVYIFALHLEFLVIKNVNSVKI